MQRKPRLFERHLRFAWVYEEVLPVEHELVSKSAKLLSRTAWGLAFGKMAERINFYLIIWYLSFDLNPTGASFRLDNPNAKSHTTPLRKFTLVGQDELGHMNESYEAFLDILGRGQGDNGYEPFK